jgi:hypothetical protein
MVIALNERGYAASTVRDTYQLVAYVFSTAQTDGLVAATPCVRVSLPRRHIEDEVKPADPEAVSAIAEAIDPRYRPLVLFLAATGVRIGEALVVRRIDLIDMPRPAVRISKTLHDDGTLGLTKTRRSRVITLAEWYAPILADHLKAGTSEMVFPSPKGKALPPRRFSSRYWRPATLNAGHPGVTPHQFAIFTPPSFSKRADRSLRYQHGSAIATQGSLPRFMQRGYEMTILAQPTQHPTSPSRSESREGTGESQLTRLRAYRLDSMLGSPKDSTPRKGDTLASLPKDKLRTMDALLQSVSRSDGQKMDKIAARRQGLSFAGY